MSTFISDLYNDHWNSGRRNQRKSDSSKSAISVRFVIVEATWFEVKCNQNEKKKINEMKWRIPISSCEIWQPGNYTCQNCTF